MNINIFGEIHEITMAASRLGFSLDKGSERVYGFTVFLQ